MEDYAKCEVSLIVRGLGLNFDLISEVLGLTPTTTVHAGVPRFPRLRFKPDTDGWFYEITDDEQSMPALLALLETSLGRNLQRVRELPTGYDVSVCCGYSSNLAQGRFEVSPENIEFLRRAGVKLTVYLWSAGEIPQRSV